MSGCFGAVPESGAPNNRTSVLQIGIRPSAAAALRPPSWGPGGASLGMAGPVQGTRLLRRGRPKPLSVRPAPAPPPGADRPGQSPGVATGRRITGRRPGQKPVPAASRNPPPSNRDIPYLHQRGRGANQGANRQKDQKRRPGRDQGRIGEKAVVPGPLLPFSSPDGLHLEGRHLYNQLVHRRALWERRVKCECRLSIYLVFYSEPNKIPRSLPSDQYWAIEISSRASL